MTRESEDVWTEFRNQMPVAKQWAYFDHAAVAPLSQPALNAIQEWSRDVTENADANWSKWRKRVEEVRSIAAKMIGADNSEIALIRNTTEGVTLVAEGFPWKPGDNVVTPEGEFPSNKFPWMNLSDRGVEIRTVPTSAERFNLDDLRAACNEKTRIIALSWVGFATGWRNDLSAIVEIARECGALVFVDAIQGLGVIPLDVAKTGIDFLAADSHKWMLGPEGAGVLYVKQEHLDRLRPIGVGWNSVRNAGNYDCAEFELKDSASRYEGGSYNMAGMHAMGASLNLLEGIGIENIEARLRAITDEICERLESIEAKIISCRERQHQSGIVACQVTNSDPHRIRKACLDASIVVNVRSGNLRLSPHAYTDECDIDRLLDVLRST